MQNFKDTLNILKTDFEMKANLNTKEPIFQKQWIENKIYQKLLERNKNNEQWILHDGPPYANGDIHVGHSLNKILKDIIVRQKNMTGLYSPFIAGWDTHGLPIEHALLKKNINKDPNLSISEKRENCKKFALENVENQKRQFSRLGLLTNFEDIYLTLTKDFEIRQLNLFAKIIEKKLAFQDFKPVYWSWASQTALAEAEIEYADVKSPSIYITFSVDDGKNILAKNDKLIVWTTTPWTIPSNLAIAVHPELTYIRFKHENNIYICAKDCLEKLTQLFLWQDVQIITEISGEKLEGVQYKHPFYNRVSPVILATYVIATDGTGLVHNAPGFGMDDYIACKKYGIDVFCPINGLGKFTSEINDTELEGVFYDASNKIITERLQKNNALIKLSFFTHSVAHDWRSKKPVIYRATKQWFIDIKKINADLLFSLDAVKFNNSINKKQIVDMIRNRTEWCISRQRVWGTPIPIIFDEHDNPLFDMELINNTISVLDEHGTNAWFDFPVEKFLTAKYRNGKKYRKETDIMDVWFDSGSSFTLFQERGLKFPVDLYLEGADQYRGWFNSSLICSQIFNGVAPYRQLISHGFTLDSQGKKMSKSLGNTIDPLQVCSKYGADILRLWVANTDWQEDFSISDNIILQTTEIYRRIRNTLFKFILANISDFEDFDFTNVKFTELEKYILFSLNENINKINEAYKNFNFSSIVKTINNHVLELSSWYFDLIKDALYCERIDDQNRRQTQAVLYTIFKTYLVLLAPIIPHTCEEAYGVFKNKKHESVIFESWPTNLHNNFIDNVNLPKWELFKKIKLEVSFVLEKLRAEKIINKNNQAEVLIKFFETELFTEKEMKYLLNVASVKIEKIDDENKMIVDAKISNFIKCERCWNYFSPDEINENCICQRCQKTVKK